MARSFLYGPCMAFVVLLLTGNLFAADQRPNVLFISVDDLNHWVGYLGRNAQTRTPNIDRLAQRGMAFTNAYAAAPVCNPSRAAVLSGMRPGTTGCYDNQDEWKNFIPEGISLASTFHRNGYRTLGAGKIHHKSTYYESEWDEYYKAPVPPHGKGVQILEGYLKPLQHDLNDDDLGDWHYVNYCIQQLGKQQDKPFFLACGLVKPHLPFAVPRKYYEQFPLDSIVLPPYREDDLNDIPPAGLQMANRNADHRKLVESGRWQEAIQAYLATIAYTDMNVGRLLDALDASPYRDNTIIVLWGDHGWHLGEKHHWRKQTLWEEATRAPLVIVSPGVTTAGSVCTRSVDFMTLYPTLCDLTGVPPPSYLEGKSVRPLLVNPKAEWNEVAVTTWGYQNHAVRTDRWRYIRYADGTEELYDHSNDPYEWNNLASLSEYTSIKQDLAMHLPRTNVAPRRVTTGMVPQIVRSTNKKTLGRAAAPSQTDQLKRFVPPASG